MNRENQIVEYIETCNGFIKNIQLQKRMGLSENTIRSSIKLINLNSKQNGFHIHHEKGRGYQFVLDDFEKYTKYKNQIHNEIDFTSPRIREEAILYYLLQSKEYITLDELSERVKVSKPIIVKDVNELERKISNLGLVLERKHHYGICVRGKETDIRKAFSKYVIGSQLYLEPIKEYRDFFEKLNHTELKNGIYKIIQTETNIISDIAFENLWAHYTTMLYRILANNSLKTTQEDTVKIGEIYRKIGRKITQYTYETLSISIPSAEIKNYILDIQSKAIIENIEDTKEVNLKQAIQICLEKLDDELYTQFSEDNELKENLFLHIYPLLTRMKSSTQLNNPLIEEIAVDYPNIFSIALRFIQMIQQEIKFDELTKDEIGFITLHFATSIEKYKKQTLSKIKRIIVLYKLGRGSATLVKIKLESVFPNANIIVLKESEMDNIKDELPDVILSTSDNQVIYKDVPVIKINEILNDKEIDRIRDLLTLQITNEKSFDINKQILSLFSKDYFQIADAKEYMDIIYEQAMKMSENGDANNQYPRLVKERETIYPTIFENAIATPHPVKLNAIHNKVGVTILKNPIRYNGLEVRMIFLINLKKDGLFLHEEIQRLILKLIEDENKRNRVLQVNSYESFIYEIRKMVR